jgi:PAS domain S-box-containing protein
MAKPLRLLLVEDSKDDADLLVRSLKESGYEPHHHRVQNAREMSAALSNGIWDIVLSDFSLPEFSGIEAFGLLKRSGKDIPFIIISGTVGEEQAVEVMRAGVNDYIMKGKLARLGPAIDRELREAEERRHRRDVEKALKVSEERLAFLLETMPLMIYSGKMEGEVFVPGWISHNVERITGFPVSKFLESRAFWTERIHPGDRDRVRRDVESLASRGSASTEYRWRCADGTDRWFLDQRVLAPGGGGPGEVVGAWLDVTERKRLEEQFLQVQKMDAVGRLAGGVAHDFNNLLTAIYGYAEVGLRGMDRESPLAQDLEEIRKCSMRASSLTRQLLAFSRQQILMPKILDLNVVVKDMHKLISRLIGEDIAVRHVLDPALGKIRADPGQMGQVIMNLVVNARDAMPRGGELVLETANAHVNGDRLSQFPDAKPGNYVMLAVRDSGDGMDAETLKRIFEPFFTTKPQGRGTGLGLATVYGIVQQSGGFIDVASEAGKGATFRIYMPTAEGPLPSPDGTSEAAGPGDLRGSETVLLVEDEESVRQLTRFILSSRGYKVLEAASPGEALILCEKHKDPIHLLLTDVVMPQMGGGELAERLAPLHPEMQVLYMSGYMDSEFVKDKIFDQGRPFLLKPFRPLELTLKVREVLEKAVPKDA